MVDLCFFMLNLFKEVKHKTLLLTHYWESETIADKSLAHNCNCLLLFICSFRHAALRSITRQKQVVKEPDKDHEQQLNLLTKSLCGSRIFSAGI